MKQKRYAIQATNQQNYYTITHYNQPEFSGSALSCLNWLKDHQATKDVEVIVRIAKTKKKGAVK